MVDQMVEDNFSFGASPSPWGFCCQFYHYRFYQLGPESSCYHGIGSLPPLETDRYDNNLEVPGLQLQHTTSRG